VFFEVEDFVMKKIKGEMCDNSKVEICIKNKRYEDMWLICKNDVEGTNVSVSKACILCFKGLKKNPKSNTWKARIDEIVEYSISTGNVNSLHVLILNKAL
jgi:hypothetical protein